MNNKNKSQNYGIHLDPDFCSDVTLTAMTRIVLGQIRQYAKGKLGCIASNGRLASDCGTAKNTVTSAIATLSERGLITVTKDKRGRRTIMAAEPGSNSHQSFESSSALPSPDPKDLGEPTSQKSGGHLNEEVNKNLRMKMKTPVSSSSVLNQVPIPDTGKNSPMGSMALEWAEQTSLMMAPREWTPRNQTPPVKIRLGRPSPSESSPNELLQLTELALKQWPECNPVLGVRQILRACSWISVRREKLQQYAHLASSDSLNARGVLRIGGKDNPLSFAVECISSVSAPLAQVELGSQEDAARIKRYAYSTTSTWNFPVWEPCWREAAGRCKAMGAPIELYMACAVRIHEKAGRKTPLPWVADSLTEDDLKTFYKLYQHDRFNAWAGGPALSASDPLKITGDYENCIGCSLAKAAAEGRTEFTSRSCLRCAAKDLRITHKLAELVHGWKGTAEELADKLDSLAAFTASDTPPSRGKACGVEESDGDPSSFIRCAHGLTLGERAWDDAPTKGAPQRDHAETAPLLQGLTAP